MVDLISKQVNNKTKNKYEIYQNLDVTNGIGNFEIKQQWIFKKEAKSKNRYFTRT